MKQIIKNEDWEQNENVTLLDNKIIFKNTTNEKKAFKYNKKITITNSKTTKIYLKNEGKMENSGGYIAINKDYFLPINSEITMPVTTPVDIEISIIIAANSTVELENIVIDDEEVIDLSSTLNSDNDCLVIVPDYPSSVNFYSCAFAHSRNKEYKKSGINLQVFAVNPDIWFTTKYERDNIPVIKGTYEELKKVLSKHQYKTVIAHFVDEKLFPIFDGNIYNNQQLIFICHGPETVYKYLVNKTRPYFTEPVKEPIINDSFDKRDKYIKKYAQKDNVEWVFVSDWLKEFSEKEQDIKFKHSRVINNIIDEKLFPYTKRKEQDRKKILVVRKFDDICQHSIDQIVFAILELSRRDVFKDLEFDIFGDGNYYNTLTAPLKDFPNVHLYRSFIPNEKLNDIYKKHGIMLLPSRHDAHAVSMGESASTGLVVVGSNVTSNPYFMNEKENHTLADPENYIELANIIERLYNNPKEFLEISKRMAEFTSQFKKDNTVKKEIELIKNSLEKYDNKSTFTKNKKVNKPILTIGVPAYNVEEYLEKCLVSILNARNSDKIEVLVINDGSTDSTSFIAEKYEKESNGIVRLINKENGGHGSAINKAIEEAKGKYFRLIDGDDWVDSENLAKLVDIMINENSDIILTKGSYDYIESPDLENIINYDSLLEGKVYNFEDLTYEGYGFEKYGPLLTTGNYKTEMLKKSNFKITEKKPYVDMEFNAFSIKNATTIVYYKLDIYRYLIGRAGQTVSPEYWKKKYKDHCYIIFNILEKTFKTNDYSERKKVYVLKNIIAPMVDSQIYMFDAVCKLPEIDDFLNKLKNYTEAYNCSLDYIKKINGNSWLILNYYKEFMKSNESGPIIIPKVRETINDINIKKSSKMHKLLKAITPYGLIVLRRKSKQNSLSKKV